MRVGFALIILSVEVYVAPAKPKDFTAPHGGGYG